jgi:hypothetical protein
VLPIPGFLRYYNIVHIIDFQNVACLNGSIHAFIQMKEYIKNLYVSLHFGLYVLRLYVSTMVTNQ